MDNRAIGIFDSGVGGLTVARAVRKLLPNESIIYFGDSIHLPYGNKSPEAIRHYSLSNTSFLLERKVKAVVVACNTSTAIAMKEISKFTDVPVIGVIDPGSAEAVRSTRKGKIGVIGTLRTVKSKQYSAKIIKRLGSAKVTEKACPLFVPLIEENFKNKKILDSIIKEYLKNIITKVDTLVLGCTHYPLIKTRIQKIYPKLKLIDSAKATAATLKAELESKNLLSHTANAKISIYTNDLNEVFTDIARRIFPGEKVKYINNEN